MFILYECYYLNALFLFSYCNVHLCTQSLFQHHTEKSYLILAYIVCIYTLEYECSYANLCLPFGLIDMYINRDRAAPNEMYDVEN